VGPANRECTSDREIRGIFLNQSNILSDGGTGAGAGRYTGGQVTGQADGREHATHRHNDDELYQSEARSGHGAEFTLSQAALQLYLEPTFDKR